LRHGSGIVPDLPGRRKTVPTLVPLRTASVRAYFANCLVSIR
jgi:hypothetical protein